MTPTFKRWKYWTTSNVETEYLWPYSCPQPKSLLNWSMTVGCLTNCDTSPQLIDVDRFTAVAQYCHESVIRSLRCYESTAWLLRWSLKFLNETYSRLCAVRCAILLKLKLVLCFEMKCKFIVIVKYTCAKSYQNRSWFIKFIAKNDAVFDSHDIKLGSISVCTVFCDNSLFRYVS